MTLEPLNNQSYLVAVNVKEQLVERGDKNYTLLDLTALSQILPHSGHSSLPKTG